MTSRFKGLIDISFQEVHFWGTFIHLYFPKIDGPVIIAASFSKSIIIDLSYHK